MTTTSPALAPFLSAIGSLDRLQLIGVLDAIDARDASGSADVSWWNATVHVESLLRSRHHTRDATAAARRAAAAIRIAAERHRLGVSGAEPIGRLARSASEAARAVVAGEDAESLFLLVPWSPVTREMTLSPAAVQRAA
jgi:hypothetical protein